MQKDGESYGETFFLRELEKKVREKKENQEENQREFKFVILEFRIEHLGDLEILK